MEVQSQAKGDVSDEQNNEKEEKVQNDGVDEAQLSEEALNISDDIVNARQISDVESSTPDMATDDKLEFCVFLKKVKKSLECINKRLTNIENAATDVWKIIGKDSRLKLDKQQIIEENETLKWKLDFTELQNSYFPLVDEYLGRNKSNVPSISEEDEYESLDETGTYIDMEHKDKEDEIGEKENEDERTAKY